MINIYETRYVGTLELNDKVDVTDPCYDKDVWCRATLECKPGIYGLVELPVVCALTAHKSVSTFLLHGV